MASPHITETMIVERMLMRRIDVINVPDNERLYSRIRIEGY
jgi:hypothetical protein